jgi:ketosteroid isomerase-like protein
MSQENVEIVRRIHEAFAEGVNERAINGLLDAGLIAPDGEIDFRNAYPDGGVVRLATMAQFDTEPWGGSMRFDVESIRAAGDDRVLALVRAHAVESESGIEVEARVAHLITLRGGQLVRIEIYTDRAEALEAAGLRG